MKIEHPRAGDADGVAPSVVDVDGEHVEVSEDGTFEIDEDQRGWLSRFASSHGHDPDDLVFEEDGPPDEAEAEDSEADDVDEEDICGYEKDDGSICERTAGWGRDADSGRCKDHVETED